ncbi:hypothetical protein LB559_09385 [Mesorhizobium sp. BR1-1-3]|nr:hypothetical protein [Mesorhizobium sp. BR1-1-3]
MSGIPEDIQKTALDMARRGYWDGLSSQDIAKAILAERKRCADIADGFHHTLVSRGSGRRAAVAWDIREAINSGDQP